MGRAAILGLLLLAGCGGAGESDLPAAERDRIECRLGSAGAFERSCTVELVEGEIGRTLVVRRPDGGFRRLRLAEDGRGIAAADGAEPARVTVAAADLIEVEIGGDTFRLPATVGAR